MGKREKSRNFDVCFGCFLVFGREKKYVERLGKRQISEKSVSPIYRVLRAIYSPGHVFEAMALIGLPASKGPKMNGS